MEGAEHPMFQVLAKCEVQQGQRLHTTFLFTPKLCFVSQRKMEETFLLPYLCVCITLLSLSKHNLVGGNKSLKRYLGSRGISHDSFFFPLCLGLIKSGELRQKKKKKKEKGFGDFFLLIFPASKKLLSFFRHS